MLGLFGMLNLGSRSLQTQQQGVEIAGQNLANVSNPAYARQRLIIQSSVPLLSMSGMQGTGVQGVGIEQLRDILLDQQVQGETSVTGFLTAQQRGLQYAEASLGETLSTTGLSSVGADGGLANGLAGLFNTFQELSAAPGSMPNRQAVIAQGQQLASRFNQVNQSLNTARDNLNQSVKTDVSSANQLLSDIAGLNKQITAAESGSRGTANDLRDLRQQKVEELSQLVNVQTARTPDGAVNISIGGNLVVGGGTVQDTLETYDAGGGQLLIRTATTGTPLTLTGGSIQGAIDVRDNSLKSLQDGVNDLASQLISAVNTVYRAGYDLNGATGADFFTGTDASDIAVTTSLGSDPSKLQASGVAGASGDNQVALALAQLADAKQPSLGNQTFSDSYAGSVTALGFSLASVNSQLDDQQVVQSMLEQQRSSVSGVSLEEEMTDLIKYQRAFQASAHLVSTIDQMLSDVVNLKQ